VTRFGSAALYECDLTHVRTAPLRNVFRYKTYTWLVDLGDLPRPSPVSWLLADFCARDHLGDPRRTIRENLEDFLRTRGVSLDGGRVWMLANARVLRYVFNPLTVYWCHRPDGSVACVVAEVHNTYGQRYAYLLDTDERGRARIPKQFYVSPFFPVDGEYRVCLPSPGTRLTLSVVLSRPSGDSFIVGLRGRRIPATTRTLAMTVVRYPWSTVAVTLRIYRQGIRLYLRGLRVQPRPPRVYQKGVL
jgi:uncharacterized protein